MLRTLTLAAAAALLAAAPASAESIRVHTAGKSADQVKAEVYKAADKLCRSETVGSTVEVGAQRACVEHTVRATLAQAQGLGAAYAQR